MTIEEMHQHRAICQSAIFAAIDKFSRDSGCIVDRVNLQHTNTTPVGAKAPTVAYSVRLTVEL